MSLLLAHLAVVPGEAVGTCAAFAMVVGYIEDAATMPDRQGGSRTIVRSRSLSADSRFWPVPPYEVY